MLTKDARQELLNHLNTSIDAYLQTKLDTNKLGAFDGGLLDYMKTRAGNTAKVMADNLRRLVTAGIPIATGTDAGNPLTLHGPAIYAEMDMMQTDGMTPMQVITSSTMIAARAMGLDARTGTIEKGKDADLVILSADPSKDVANFRKVKYVVRAGVVRTSEELSAMAQ